MIPMKRRAKDKNKNQNKIKKRMKYKTNKRKLTAVRSSLRKEMKKMNKNPSMKINHQMKKPS